MRRLWRWWRSRRGLHQIRTTRLLLLRHEKQSRKIDKRLMKRRKELKALSKRMDVVSISLTEDLDEAERAHSQYQETIDGLRSELQVLRDITVPNLTAAHRLILERYDAETAIAVRNRVAVSTDMSRVE
jgi:hypothetical protein